MKKKIGSVQYMFPVPIVLIGTVGGNGDVNFTEVGDCAVAGINPPLIMISLNINHMSACNISKTGSFSVNIPNTGIMNKTDYCGIHSGTRKDKSKLFGYVMSEIHNTPIIEECPLCMECEVVGDFKFEQRWILIGKVTETYADERYIETTDGKSQLSDIIKFDPILYALDNRYYSIGKIIGQGYAEGKKIDKEV